MPNVKLLTVWFAEMSPLFILFFLYKNKEENFREKPLPRTLFWRLVSFSSEVKLLCHLSWDNFLDYKQETLNLLHFIDFRWGKELYWSKLEINLEWVALGNEVSLMIVICICVCVRVYLCIYLHILIAGSICCWMI